MNAIKNNGFTLVELMVTISILGILAAIGIPNMARMLSSNQMSIAQDNVAQMLSKGKALAMSRGVIATIVISPASGTAAATASLTLSDGSPVTGIAGAATSDTFTLDSKVTIGAASTYTINPTGVTTMTPASGVAITATNYTDLGTRRITVSPLGSVEIIRN